MQLPAAYLRRLGTGNNGNRLNSYITVTVTSLPNLLTWNNNAFLGKSYSQTKENGIDVPAVCNSCATWAYLLKTVHFIAGA